MGTDTDIYAQPDSWLEPPPTDCIEPWLEEHLPPDDDVFDPSIDERINDAENIAPAAELTPAEAYDEMPTTVPVAGSILQQQIDALKRAEERIEALARSVSDVDRRRLDVYSHCDYPASDIENMNRITQRYGFSELVSRGREWLVWGGANWVVSPLRGGKYVAKLPAIIREAARRADETNEKIAAKYAAACECAKETGEAEPPQPNFLNAEKLFNWSEKSASSERQSAAEKMAQRMLQMEPNEFDSDRNLLNVLNGTIDLKTGELLPHDPNDYITYCVKAKYRPDKPAPAPLFRRAVLQCMGEDTLTETPLSDFFQRWIGYCATGETSEHVMLVHHGDGSNGKSMLIGIINAILGGHLGSTAVHGLFSAQKKRAGEASGEIAAMLGKRLVTAHESGDGDWLREDLIKQLTGGDEVTARHLYGREFTFLPTHKIQLLTNHKPQVRGQDNGIWRRLLLLSWRSKFGNTEQLEAGDATHLLDKHLANHILMRERDGVLAWIVEGAVQWHKHGLMPPPGVTRESAAYRKSEDRIGSFIAECCDVGPDLSERLVDGLDGVYPTYQKWCKESGILPQSKTKFTAELLQDKRFYVQSHNVKRLDGQYRKQPFVHGLKIQ